MGIQKCKYFWVLKMLELYCLVTKWASYVGLHCKNVHKIQSHKIVGIQSKLGPKIMSQD